MKKGGIYHLFREDENKYALPNALTVLRLVFLPFIIYFLYKTTRTSDIIALGLMVLAGVTDYFDGYFARKLGKTSDVGRMLDPLIDKISVGLTMIVLAQVKGLPYWYVGIVIARDLFLLFTGTMVISRHRLVVESNQLGKWTSTLFALVIITFTLNVPVIKQIFMYSSAILVPVTVVGYISRYRHDFRIVNTRQNTHTKKD
jgi:CDP-diacylglycerol--glycerol-3-phosphate 3-phosphatidyltransferase